MAAVQRALEETASFSFEMGCVGPAVWKNDHVSLNGTVLVVYSVTKMEVGLDPRVFLLPSLLVFSDEEAHRGRPGWSPYTCPLVLGA